MRSVVAAAALAAAVFATPAVAQDGFLACMASSPSNGKVFLTNPVPGTEAQATEVAARFRAMLGEKVPGLFPEGQSGSEYCRYFPTNEKAQQFISNLRQGVAAKGGSTMSLPFSG